MAFRKDKKKKKGNKITFFYCKWLTKIEHDKSNRYAKLISFDFTKYEMNLYFPDKRMLKIIILRK